MLVSRSKAAFLSESPKFQSNFSPEHFRELNAREGESLHDSIAVYDER